VTYGTVSRGAPLVADGKLYVFDVNAKMAVYKLKGDEEPEELETIPFRKETGVGFVETHGTPIAVNGRLYFLTQDFLYCVGKGEAAGAVGYKPLADEPKFDPMAKPVGLRILPADVTVDPGKPVTMAVEFLDANGRVLPAPADAAVEWSLPLPPKAPTGAQPPALVGDVKGAGPVATLTAGKLPSQQGTVLAKAGALSARARVRVAARPPYTQDFDRVPTGATPGGWVNVQGKYTVAEVNGAKVLSKVNTDARPPIARANGYITGPTAGNYTIEADVMGTEARGRLPDLGVVNSRYTLILDGKSDSANNKRQARVVSWEARPRINKAAEFDWQPGVWYRVKLTVEPNEKTATVRAKVWKKDEAEPAGWTVQFEDPSPNREGAAAVYAYISDPSISDKQPGSNAYFDNVSITPNGNK
jgi:hypothetical protein